MMRTFEKLRLKIEKDTGWKLYDFRRTYAGHNMLSSGAPSWIAKVIDRGEKTTVEVWGCETATALLKQDKIEFAKGGSLGSPITIF